MSLVIRARTFASAAHAAIDQRRKYTGEPYIMHPLRVVSLVSHVKHTEQMLAAAWLHDVVEDTAITLEHIEAEFGSAVFKLVEELSDVDCEGNRAARKLVQLERMRYASWQAQTIKLADLTDNSQSIIKHDPAFAKVFVPEARDLLAVLKNGDKSLWYQLGGILEGSV